MMHTFSIPSSACAPDMSSAGWPDAGTSVRQHVSIQLMTVLAHGLHSASVNNCLLQPQSDRPVSLLSHYIPLANESFVQRCCMGQ
jgi:hypothetical protein